MRAEASRHRSSDTVNADVFHSERTWLCICVIARWRVDSGVYGIPETRSRSVATTACSWWREDSARDIDTCTGRKPNDSLLRRFATISHEPDMLVILISSVIWRLAWNIPLLSAASRTPLVETTWLYLSYRLPLVIPFYTSGIVLGTQRYPERRSRRLFESYTPGLIAMVPTRFPLPPSLLLIQCFQSIDTSIDRLHLFFLASRFIIIMSASSRMYLFTYICYQLETFRWQQSRDDTDSSTAINRA